MSVSLATAATNPLNDTGIDVCRAHADGADTPVTATATCTAAQGGQDARHGRAAAAVAGALSKTGASATTRNANPNGFDYTKISNAGAALPATATLGPNPGDWACTRDNTTGLIWEVKTTSGLRNQAHTYTWYDSVHNYGGNPGTANGGTCQTAGRCDTEKYAAAVNAAGLCGHTDWRLPTLPELYNLADRGRLNPAIDPDYFPNTPSYRFWSASPSASDSDSAWYVKFFGYGYEYWNLRDSAYHVRLVRAGQ